MKLSIKILVPSPTYGRRLRNNRGSTLISVMVGGVVVLASFYFVMSGISSITHVSETQVLKTEAGNLLDERLAYMRSRLGPMGVPIFVKTFATSTSALGDPNPILDQNPNDSFSTAFPGRTLSESILVSGHPFTLTYDIQLYTASFNISTLKFDTQRLILPSSTERLNDLRLLKLVAQATESGSRAVSVTKELSFAYPLSQ